MTSHETNMVALLEDLAIKAGAVIMELREQGVVARSKSDKSPVTEADEQAEAIILAGLAAHFPQIPVVAEEAAAAGHLPASLGSQFFLVDPLDGTKEFVSGNGDFTVNIALIENGHPVCGVVYAPVHGSLFSAEGNVATKALVVAGKIESRVQLSQVQKSVPTKVVASRSHMTEQTEAFLKAMPDCQTVQVGSSLKFCILAEGKAEVYPRFGRTMEWDTAAGDAVLRAAGGTTKTLDGVPLSYGKRNQADDTDFANPHFVSVSGAV
ncbi:MAG: 3'(2'),5'-bisphosphate nucleotidase CysQ [Rhizobiaceae bacterium]